MGGGWGGGGGAALPRLRAGSDQLTKRRLILLRQKLFFDSENSLFDREYSLSNKVSRAQGLAGPGLALGFPSRSGEALLLCDAEAFGLRDASLRDEKRSEEK